MRVRAALANGAAPKKKASSAGGAGVAPSGEEGAERMADRLHRMAERLGAKDLRIAIKIAQFTLFNGVIGCSGHCAAPSVFRSREGGVVPFPA